MFKNMKDKPETPKVGVGVLIERDGKILMMLRYGSHRADTWAIPGGHLELGETFLEVCQREVMEEVGLEVESVEHMDFTNAIFLEEGLHYVTLYLKATLSDPLAEPRIMEPDKTRELKWVLPTELPEPLFSQNMRGILERWYGVLLFVKPC